MTTDQRESIECLIAMFGFAVLTATAESNIAIALLLVMQLLMLISHIKYSRRAHAEEKRRAERTGHILAAMIGETNSDIEVVKPMERVS